MRKLLLFPYHPDIELLIRQAADLKDVSIVGVCSFREDQSIVDKVNQTLGCACDFEERIRQCDAVLLLDDYRESEKKKYYDVIRASLGEGKQVMIMPLLARELDLEEFHGQYIVLSNILKSDFAKTKKEMEWEKIKYTIESPVVAVFGMGKNCCKFENQILLKSILDKEGYKCIWISSNPLGALFGAYTIPDFLYDDCLAFEEKVLRFNHFVYQLSANEKPDVFVIGIPEGISKFSSHEYNHFAEYPLVIGSAVPVDSAVFCTYFMPKADVDGLKEMIYHCREKFGFPVHMVSIGRTAFERKSEFKQMAYLFLEEEYLRKHYEAVSGQPDACAGIWEAEQIEIAVQQIIDWLRGNPDAI